MSLPLEPMVVASLAGLAGGLGMLARGLGAYRISNRIADTAGSRISSIAAGEARVTGVVEPADMLLTSPLQSVPCVYYRAVVEEDEQHSVSTVFRGERAVGFRIRDDSGALRVFPRGARWAIADRFHDQTSLLGDEPADLDIRLGPELDTVVTDHDAAVERLLTVRAPQAGDPRLAALLGPGHRRYREARIEPGDTVTAVGFVQPFGRLSDPTAADDASFADDLAGDPLSDPAIAADLEAARASGQLADSPDDAWGNAAIPGFGIGHPTRAPHLDPAATPLPIADAATATRIERAFTIRPDELVLTAADDVPLLVTSGAPTQAAEREEGRFLVGLLGAVLAITSAMALAAVVGGLVA